ncbi:hypothetical protein ACIBCN_44285 [Nocardia sp. NPDC051052]|uniref:hypothetical protein n=1 Tax=Nocardia sp. NPDC051052 TaxID=3364322 RepID=UPI00378F847C
MDARLNGNEVRHGTAAGWKRISRELGLDPPPTAPPLLSTFERRLLELMVVASVAVAIMRYRESRRS